MSAETVITATAVLLLLSVLFSKASEKLGVPALLLFLGIGMLAGSEGIGGIHFDDPEIAQFLGTVALSFILFAGGMDTDFDHVRPVLWRGVSLATLGVLLTAILLGSFCVWTLNFTLMEGMMLGAIVASTDAAAVFSVLRSRNVSLKGQLRPLLELESGSNDPMAVFLTIGLISLASDSDGSLSGLAIAFLLQMPVGALIGYALAKGGVVLINRVKLEYEGLYPALTVSLVLLAYGLSTLLKGNGFLAVYVTGLVIGNSSLLHRGSLLRFHDGIAWLMQIVMFLTLGLLVFPSRLGPIGQGLAVSLFLMFAARPVSVFLSLAASKTTWREKLLVSWVGLRGAVPIVLATFPLVAGVSKADDIFNIVFFIVLTSALLQGVSIPAAARLLKVDTPFEAKRPHPLEIGAPLERSMKLADLFVPYESPTVGKPLVELNFPEESRIVLVCRGEEFVVPAGTTSLEGGDVLWVLAKPETIPQVQKWLARGPRTEEAERA
jgi:potassium/hydrogen antiporter